MNILELARYGFELIYVVMSAAIGAHVLIYGNTLFFLPWSISAILAVIIAFTGFHSCMKIINSSSYTRFGFELIYATVCFAVGAHVLIYGNTFLTLPWFVSAILTVMIIISGLHASMRAYVLLRTENTSDQQEIPQYGYRDHWERENL